MVCVHTTVSIRHGVYLKPQDRPGPCRKHVYCTTCGQIKYSGGDRPRDPGYFMNILSEIERYINLEIKKGIPMPRITAVQKRLIARAIEESDVFVDTFSVTGRIQKDVFKRLVRHYTPNLPGDLIESFL